MLYVALLALGFLCRSANAALFCVAPLNAARRACGSEVGFFVRLTPPLCLSADAPRQRTGLDCVAPSALCEWAAEKCVSDWDICGFGASSGGEIHRSFDYVVAGLPSANPSFRDAELGNALG